MPRGIFDTILYEIKIRKKKNKSGSISIHIVDRSGRGYKVVESLGSSKDPDEIERLNRIDELENNLLYFSKINSKKNLLKKLLSEHTMQDFIPIGDELIFGRLFNAIGCNKVFQNLQMTDIRNRILKLQKRYNTKMTIVKNKSLYQTGI